MNRREFTLEAALAVLGGAVITISGCGGGGSGSPTSSSGSNGGSNATEDKRAGISGNHGHVAVITAAQLVAGNAITLDIRGSADHTHTVTVAADEIVNIRAGMRIQKECTTGFGHSHTATFNPTDPNDPARY